MIYWQEINFNQIKNTKGPNYKQQIIGTELSKDLGLEIHLKLDMKMWISRILS